MLDVRLPDYPFAISLYVWFRDLDAMGHVNNAVYFTYFEQARTRYWLSLLSEGPADPLHHPFDTENDYRKIGFIVVHAEADYASPAKMGESLLIGCKLSEIKKSSFTFEYRVVAGERTASETDVRLVASGKTVQVLYDWAEEKKLPFSEELRKKVEAREGSRLRVTMR